MLVPKLEAIMGKLVQVEIIECTKFSMIGKIVDDFNILDKNHIYTLNVSATQQLHKIIIAKEWNKWP